MGQSTSVHTKEQAFVNQIDDSTTDINAAFEKIAGYLRESGFSGLNEVPNPESEVFTNPENGMYEFYGGTFAISDSLHETLAGSLEKSLTSCGANESVSGGTDKSTEVRILHLLHDGINKLNTQYTNISNSINEKINTLHSLQVFLKKGFNRLTDLVDNNKSEAKVVAEVQDAILKEIDRQLLLLQNLVKVNVKPTKETLSELLKKNKNFTALAETLGTGYNTEEASDRLALVFTNISQLGLTAEKVKEALKTLNISLKEYREVRNMSDLKKKVAKVLQSLKGKKNTELNNIIEAIKILENNQISHEKIVKCLENNKNCSVKKIVGSLDTEEVFTDGAADEEVFTNGAADEEVFTNGGFDPESDGASDPIEFFDPESDGAAEGGAYSKEVGRLVKPRLQSALSKRIKTYEQTMKELYKSFMNQINLNFKELSVLLELLSTKIGSEISYDEDLKKFINMFMGLNESLNNEKIFYALINLNTTVAGKEEKNRFNDNLNKIIISVDGLKDYKLFKDISKVLKSFRENIDTYSDTVLNIQKEEGEKHGSSDYIWGDKLLDQSFSMNNIKLIKDSIKKLSFFGKVSSIKENLLRMNKEHKYHQEDYGKLLGKSIGAKLSELNKEYVENIDRLNDKLRGRGYLLDQHNASKSPTDQDYLPRGLVENIYKIQYEAKEGLYKTVETIDLYLMDFTELLSGNPDAIMDLNKMLEQTEIIAKWFTKKSVDNLSDLFTQNIDYNEPTDIDDKISDLLQKELNLPPLLQSKTIFANKIKIAYEQCKKSIDSIAILKNIISMFVHIGEKFGNENLSKRSLMSPNMIYKNLVKYIWVSAFTMGYGTGGGDTKADISITDTGKGLYEPEKGDFGSFFDVLFTTIILPLDLYKQVEQSIMPMLNLKKVSGSVSIADKTVIEKVLNKLKSRDIFIIDDKYFILTLKAMVGKIFTVIDTNRLLKRPDTLVNVIRNPVRSIIGAAETPDVIPEAIELYIRLPLLVEFYKEIFENGNDKYKKNIGNSITSEKEVIAYIPEFGNLWSGLIQCIFDESRYIDQGIYSLNNMKDLVYEVNKIYKHYSKSVSADKLVRTAILDLIAEVNRRYGILKQKDITEFYQLKKKYVKNNTDIKLDENVNFDILDENNEYQLEGPSSMYVEKQFNKYSDDSLVITDIQMVKDFRNKIYNELFGNLSNVELQSLSKKSFSEKIKYYKKQIVNEKSIDSKFELISSAIDQSSNINAYNFDLYFLYLDLFVTPLTILENLYTQIKTQNLLLIRDLGTPAKNKLELITGLYQQYNDNNLIKIKFISNNKIILDYSVLQNTVEQLFENCKYILSKFRMSVCKDFMIPQETKLFKLENDFLNILIKDDNSVENYDTLKGSTFENLNREIANLVDSTNPYNISDLYHHIMFDNLNNNLSFDPVVRNNPVLKDVMSVYDVTSKTWVEKNGANGTNFVNYYNLLLPNNNITDYNSFKNKSVLQKFNMLVFSYIEQFYNSSSKKIYVKLFDEFANKTMSSTIFDQGGILDVNESGAIDNVPKNLTFGVVQNDSVLSLTISNTLRTLLTRTLNAQLPIKYHLLENINDVSSVQIEKYKAYLPLFITYFEYLVKECNLYKKILDNNKLVPADILATNPNNGVIDPFLAAGATLTNDLKQAITTSTVLNNVNASSDYIQRYHAILNNIMNGARSLINDAKNVLLEINYVPQYGNLRDNFIKNFYNNNNELPYNPVNLLSQVNESNKANSISTLLPIHPIGSAQNKYIYATNYVFNNLSENKEEDINEYLWLKEQVKKYNNSALSTNVLDSKKLNSLLTNIKHVTKFGYITNHINYNLYHDNTIAGLNANNILSTELNDIENLFTENKKAKKIQDKLAGLCPTDTEKADDLTRHRARLLNIIDLNVMPINVHALLREIPLINIYNYAFTFDDVIKSMIYNIEPEKLYTGSALVKNLFNMSSKNNENLILLSTLLQDPYFVNYRNYTDSATIIEKHLSLNYQPDKKSDKKDIYLSSPKFLVNVLEKLKPFDTPAAKTNKPSTLYYNNKFFRNVLFLVNLQRAIRLKIKSAVYQINSNVVSDSNILNMRITEYPIKDDTDIKDDEFEITDLF